jgi:hypothetical protein
MTAEVEFDVTTDQILNAALAHLGDLASDLEDAEQYDWLVRLKEGAAGFLAVYQALVGMKDQEVGTFVLPQVIIDRATALQQPATLTP